MAGNTVEGLDELMRFLKKLPQEMREQTRAVFLHYADLLLEELKKVVWVDTGALRSTLRKSVKKNGLDARVGFFGVVQKRLARKKKSKGDAEPELMRQAGFIAVFKEYGTKKMPADPVVYRTWDRIRPEFLKDISAAIERLVEKGK